MRRLAAAVLLVAAIATPTQDLQLTPLAAIDFGGPPVTHVAISPCGTVAAFADAGNVVTCIDLAVEAAATRLVLPPGRLVRLVCHDADCLDVWLTPSPRTAPARRRLSRSAGGLVAGPVVGSAPAATDPASCRAWFREHAWWGARKLAAVAMTADARAGIALWTSGHVETLHHGGLRQRVDADCRALALTADGRRVVALLTTRVVVADVADGRLRTLPVAVDTLRGLAAAGPDFVLVDDRAVQLWRGAPPQPQRQFDLPRRDEVPPRVTAARGGPGSLVALGGWYPGDRPWVALLDLDTGRWREFECLHGAMDWSADGTTLVVGTGNPGCGAFEPSCVRLVPRDGGDVQHVATPGSLGVTCVPGGGFLVSDSSANAFLHLAGAVRRLPGVLWGPCAALSPEWLLTSQDGLTLRRIGDDTLHTVLPAPVEAIAAVRVAHRVAVATRRTLHVFAWPPAAPNRGAPARRPW
jgi:hypothetical protein